MAYGDPPTPNTPIAPGQYQDYPPDYQYMGDTFRGMMPSDQAAQVRKALFEVEIPKTSDEFEACIPMLRSVIDSISRTPGYGMAVWGELNRDMEDIVDRMHSQGRSKIVASKMQKFFFKVRSLVPVSDAPLPGLSGIGAMITTNVNQKQEVRMPQQPQSAGFIDMINPFKKR